MFFCLLLLSILGLVRSSEMRKERDQKGVIEFNFTSKFLSPLLESVNSCLRNSGRCARRND